MKKTLLDKIMRLLIFQKNINISQLARETNLPQQTLQRLVSGTSTNPHEKTVKTLADFFGLSVEQMKGERALPADTNSELTTRFHPDVKKIPLLAWEQIDLCIKDPIKNKSPSCIFVDAKLSDATFATFMPDASMEPYIPEGSTLIFSSNRPTADRQFVLAKLQKDNVILFRQLLYDANDRYLKPMNPDLNAFSMRSLEKKDKLLGILLEYRHCY